LTPRVISFTNPATATQWQSTYHKAIQFCADQDTRDGEAWLEDCGGIAQPGDSFGQIACRIAFATLLCAAEDALQELRQESATV
jgi:hypothetical protein